MPIYLHESISPEGELGLWDISESVDFFLEKISLNASEEKMLEQVVERRRKEWLAGRYLLYHMSGRGEAPKVEKDGFGKPFIQDSKFDISLSHSGRFAAVIASSKSVGIDIQQFTPKVKRIEHKFMTEEDSEWMSEDCNLEHLHVCWGAKEAMYKAYGKKKLEFREHILLEPFEYDVTFGRFSGYVKKEDVEEGVFVDMSFDIFYRVIENYMLVYAIEKNEK